MRIYNAMYHQHRMNQKFHNTCQTCQTCQPPCPACIFRLTCASGDMSNMSATRPTRRRIPRANKKYQYTCKTCLTCNNPCCASLFRNTCPRRMCLTCVIHVLPPTRRPLVPVTRANAKSYIHVSYVSYVSAPLPRLVFSQDMSRRMCLACVLCVLPPTRRVPRTNKKSIMHLLNVLMCYNPCPALLIRISTSPAHVLHVLNVLHSRRIPGS